MHGGRLGVALKTLVLGSGWLSAGALLAVASRARGASAAAADSTPAPTTPGGAYAPAASMGGASAAYYNNLLLQLEGSEPSATIGDNATLLAILQTLKRRFVNKTTVSGTTLTWYKDDASTALQTQTIADDGSTATVGATS